MSQDETVPRAETLSADMVDLLQEMGLSHRDVQIYEYLLKSGGAIPSAIARDTGHPRGRIYEGMRNLATKGFARERPTRPIVFCPTPLADVLAAAQARLSRHLSAVQLAGTPGVAAPAAAEPEPPVRLMRMRDVSVLSGRRACNAEVLRMLEASTSFFWMAGGGRLADRLNNMPHFLEGVKAAASRGVDVRIIFPKAKAIGRALTLLDAGRARAILHQVTGEKDEPSITCATESATVEMVVQPDDDAPTRGDDVAIHVADRMFAAKVKRRLDLLVGTPAPQALPGVYPWLGPDHGSDIFGDAIVRARTEVQVLGPAEWGTYLRSNWEQHGAAYAAARSRGVILRVVATPEAATAAEMARFHESWDIRLVPQLPMWLTIIDGKELYQAFPHPSLGGVPQFRRSEEFHEIRFLRGVFERLWATASPLEASRTKAGSGVFLTTPNPTRASSG